MRIGKMVSSVLGSGYVALSLACNGELPPIDIERYENKTLSGIVENENYIPGIISNGFFRRDEIPPHYIISIRSKDGTEALYKVVGFNGLPERADIMIDIGDSVGVYERPDVVTVTGESETLYYPSSYFDRIMREKGAISIGKNRFVVKQ